ncbi:DUF397 domain-containing protein [Nocardia uniformis]|uniref:DUF397 domain-containing protein n=1 Tax=Nocardia uniformis TaxID=53432 RepID=A0A849CHV2_9NOCA|nr:DUF397 domain-containing protein [Nocardia uniformis]NNH75659.1 DUF397 domain-containing protein [Nocardia uniformis]
MNHHASPHDGWYKTTRSNGATQCVEVRFDSPNSVRIRDSKFRRHPDNIGRAEPTLTVAPAEWRDFLAVVTNRASDSHDAVLTATHAGDVVVMTSTLTTVSLSFTVEEWEAFLAGARDGEFDIEVNSAA